MWPIIKCFFFGHYWRLFGISEINHIVLNENREMQSEKIKSHLIFYCKCCCKMWEYECQTRYQFQEIRDDEQSPSST